MDKKDNDCILETPFYIFITSVSNLLRQSTIRGSAEAPSDLQTADFTALRHRGIGDTIPQRGLDRALILSYCMLI